MDDLQNAYRREETGLDLKTEIEQEDGATRGLWGKIEKNQFCQQNSYCKRRMHATQEKILRYLQPIRNMTDYIQ